MAIVRAVGATTPGTAMAVLVFVSTKKLRAATHERLVS